MDALLITPSLRYAIALMDMRPAEIGNEILLPVFS
jgi:hypothetical protein